MTLSTLWLPRWSQLALMLLHPALIIIDYGHFQYNSVCLGLALAAFVCFSSSSSVTTVDLIGACLFVGALCFKQIGLYYAPAVFAFLLAKLLKSSAPIQHLIKLGATVIIAFAVCFLPFLHNIDDILQGMTHETSPYIRAEINSSAPRVSVPARAVRRQGSKFLVLCISTCESARPL